MAAGLYAPRELKWHMTEQVMCHSLNPQLVSNNCDLVG